MERKESEQPVSRRNYGYDGYAYFGKAIKNLTEIMDEATAQRFVTTLEAETAPGEAPRKLFIVVDSWGSILADVKRKFKKPVSAAAMYSWLIQYLDENYGDIGSSLAASDLVKDTSNQLRDIKEQRNELQREVLEEQRRAAENASELGLARVVASQPAPPKMGISESEFESRLPQYILDNRPFLWVVPQQQRGLEWQTELRF